MDSNTLAFAISFGGLLVGAVTTYLINKQLLRHQLTVLHDEFKTEFAAEDTARHFLKNAAYTDRSFETLQRHLGGFGDDELRKILVRAGAIRTYREDGTEWWRLLERMDEYISKKKANRGAESESRRAA